MPRDCQWGSISLLTIILFLILIGSIGWGVYYFRQQPINQELPRQIKLSTPEPSPTPSPIKTYTHPTLGFSLEYPDSWQFKEVIVQKDKTLHSLLEFKPSGYIGTSPVIKLLSIDNPNKLSLKELDKQLIIKKGQSILFSSDDVYTLTGSGLAVNFRNEGDCDGKKCQIYTFSHGTQAYQLESFLDANVFEQRLIFDRIVNSIKFNDFSKPEALSASASANPH